MILIKQLVSHVKAGQKFSIYSSACQFVQFRLYAQLDIVHACEVSIKYNSSFAGQYF
jgi:hypothetical protein